MRKLIYKITEETNTSKDILYIEFITDRGTDWTETQYMRNRNPMVTKMELVSDEETKEKEPTSRKAFMG
tara:strand:+ start:264 stop:470 length:207 start_codon:yes stop_codon:yes gene_type:complete